MNRHEKEIPTTTKAAMETIQKRWLLSSFCIQNKTIIAECSRTSYDAKMLHGFLSDTPLHRTPCAIYHPDHFFGYFSVYRKDTETFYLAGPYLRLYLNDRVTVSQNRDFHTYMRYLHIPLEERTPFFSHICALPVYGEPAAIQHIRELHRYVFGDFPAESEIEIVRTEHLPDLEDFLKQPQRSPFIDASLLPAQNADWPHLRPGQESLPNENDSLNYYIENGDPAGLWEYVTTTEFTLTTGFLKDELKNALYSAISLMSLASQAAVRGGLSFSQAQYLLDLYIAYASRLTNVEELLELEYRCMEDYATQVQKVKIPGGLSPAVRATLSYINENIGQKISLAKMAARVRISPQYLSARFTAEMQMTLTDYITQKRVELASHLLSATDLPIAQIAETCGYSSQSYFQNVFKKETGMTPCGYRRQTSR